VQNVTIRNFTIDARSWAIRWSGYHCTIENLTLVNADDMVVGNALAYSTIRNIKGTFGRRAIEIKTGSYHLVVENIQGTYKQVDQSSTETGNGLAYDEAPKAIVSLGEYSRNITVRNFNFDLLTHAIGNFPLIELQGRKSAIADGSIFATAQIAPLLKFHACAAPSAEFGAYHNTLSNLTLVGSKQNKTVIDFGSGSTLLLQPLDNLIISNQFLSGNSSSVAEFWGGDGNSILHSTFQIPESGLSFHNAFTHYNLQANTMNFQQ
jgi:hypothetical protein